MSARWKIEYICNGSREFLYMSAADAKSVKRAHITAAVRNAATRAKSKLEKAYPNQKIKIIDARCVG
jgi:hypothetical protein